MHRGREELSIERVDDLDALEAEWGPLAEATGHPFATWEWNALWWRRFSAGRSLYTFACRRPGGELAVILPLYRQRLGPFRMARLLGDGDLRGPICASEDRAAAAACLRQVNRPGRESCSLLLAERLPAKEGWAAGLGGRRLAMHPDPALPLGGISWEELLASRSRNFRQQVRRRERRALAELGLSYRLCTDPARLEADMEAVAGLHRVRWEEESSGVFSGARREFHYEFAAAALRRGWLRLWLAEAEGGPVAAWYGWRFAGSEWYYQAGRDPRFDDYSLGFVLLAHTIREACNDGAKAYRFLAGDEPYKWRFGPEDMGAETRLVARGAAARSAALGMGLAARAPAPIRRRVMRRLG